MKKIASLRHPVALMILLGLASTAQAGYSYNYVADPAPASIQVGSNFLLNVYIQETVTGADAPRLVGPGNGLFSAAVRVAFGASAAARVLADSDVLPNSADFADTLAAGLIDPGAAQLNEQVPLSSFDPVAGTVVAPGVSRIKVGSFRFTAVAPGSVVVTLSDLNPTLDDVIAADGFVLDPVLQQGTVQFNVVPEPASVALMGVGIFAIGCLRLGGRRWRPVA